MSASLVGSEMCIRDSSWGGLGTALVGAGSHALLSVCKSAWEMERCRLPVSYTHLTLPTICSV
eukprot:14152816-Alexandrium_andersonii.AAC.1